MMKNKFDYYEVVKISSKRPALKKINGCKGFISRISHNEETGSWSYAVSVYDDEGYLWSVKENELITTRKKVNPKDSDAGEIIKIRVNPKTGEGEVTEDDED